MKKLFLLVCFLLTACGTIYDGRLKVEPQYAYKPIEELVNIRENQGALVLHWRTGSWGSTYQSEVFIDDKFVGIIGGGGHAVLALNEGERKVSIRAHKVNVLLKFMDSLNIRTEIVKKTYQIKGKSLQVLEFELSPADIQNFGTYTQYTYTPIVRTPPGIGDNLKTTRRDIVYQE